MSYNATYKSTKDVFGKEPEFILKQFYGQIDKSFPVLDIGTGQGRNAFFLARQGLMVHALDPSSVAIETIADKTQEENLSITAFISTFSDFEPPIPVYSGILLFGLIQILSWQEIDQLKKKLGIWSAPESLIFVTGFSIEDASYTECERNWQPLGHYSFQDGSGNIQTFLEPGEILKLFNGYDVLYYWEGMGPEHRHGSGLVERHGVVEFVGRRGENTVTGIIE